MAAALMEELLEEVLVRFPPDDPASLVRAALVSKRWCRLICGRGFRRRFREFHGTPPLLGFVCQRGCTLLEPFFIPSSSFRPRDRDLADDRRYMTPVHSCHGRVLLHSGSTRCLSSYRMIWEDLFVWDPITNKLRSLPRWPLYSRESCRRSNAAVLCADAVVGDGCNHLDCHHGHFRVVFVGIDDYEQTFTCASTHHKMGGASPSGLRKATGVSRWGTLSLSAMPSTSSVASEMDMQSSNLIC